MTRDDITKVINLCADAVHESKVGPFFVKDERSNISCTQAAFQTFITVLNCVCPKAMTATLTDPKEDWNRDA